MNARGLEESDLFTPRFDANGLIPCVTVDDDTGEVLMVAWMNDAALKLTLESGFVHYWSRSRQSIWKKGETSGALQRILEVRTDCDQDVVLIRAKVEDRANTCHTGRDTCFYRRVPLGSGPIERSFSSTDAELD
jgi:phosphoribosyl-AMP cyclohydrolase